MKIQRSIMGITILLMLCSCATAPLTPKQTCLWGMNVHNLQYEMFVKQIVKPEFVNDILNPSFGSNQTVNITTDMIRTDLTEEQKEVLRQKKAILQDLYPVVRLCDEAIRSGVDPDQETYDDLIYLINRLLEDL